MYKQSLSKDPLNIFAFGKRHDSGAVRGVYQEEKKKKMFQATGAIQLLVFFKNTRHKKSTLICVMQIVCMFVHM